MEERKNKLEWWRNKDEMYRLTLYFHNVMKCLVNDIMNAYQNI